MAAVYQRGKKNKQIDTDAKIQSYKLSFDPTQTGEGQPGLTLTTGVDPTAADLGMSAIPRGYIYYHPTDAKCRLYDGSSFGDLATAAGGDTLDAAYNGGASITVDAGAVTLAGSHATNNQLAITSTSAAASGNALNITTSGATASGDAISVTISGATATADAFYSNISQAGATGHNINLANAGSGKLINSTNFTVTPAGAITAVSAALSGNLSAGTGAFSGAVTMGSNLTITGNLSVSGSFTLPATTIADNVDLSWGTTTADLAIRSDGTNAFIHSPNTHDVVLNFGYDNTVSTKRLDISMFGATQAAKLVLDASANTYTNTGIQHILSDNTAVTFGDSTELSIKSNGTGAFVGNSVNDTVLYFGNDGVVYTTRMDVVVYGATSAANLTLDASGNLLTNTSVKLRNSDNTIVSFGDADDVAIKWDATDLLVTAAAADATIVKLGTAANAIDLWLAGAGTATVKFDSSAKTLTFDDVDVYVGDNDNVALGDSQDVNVVWNATDLLVTAAAADATIVKIGAAANQIDVWFNGAGTATTKYDSSAKTWTYDDTDVYFGDADILAFGDAQDVTMRWDATDFLIDPAAANSIIKIGSATQADLWLVGPASSIKFDASAKTWTHDDIDLYLGDNDSVAFGDAQDVNIVWNATDLLVTAAAADSTIIKVGAAANQIDLWLNGVGTGTIKYDSSAATMTFDEIDLKFGDTDYITFGDGAGGDVTVNFDATNLVVATTVANTAVNFGEGTTNLDLKWFGSAAGNYAHFDASENTLDLTNNVKLRLFTQTPAASAANGATGEIAWDASYIYICTAGGTPGTWERVAIATW